MKSQIPPNLATVILLLLTLSFSSCDKNKIEAEEEVQFPVELHFSSIIAKSKIRFFVGNKEITDTKIIDDFAKRRGFFDYKNADLSTFKNIKIVFTEKDSLVYYAEPRKYSYTKSKDFFRITTYYNMKLKDNDFINYIAKYPYDKTPIANSKEYDFSTKEFLTGYGNFKDFNLNVLMFILKSKQPNGYSERNGVIYNEFNESIMSKLQTSDSLIVQEFAFKFKSR